MYADNLCWLTGIYRACQFQSKINKLLSAIAFDETKRLNMKMLLWLLLFVLCWPLALLALVLYPVFWLISLPFRLVGIAAEGLFELLRAIVLLPSRLLSIGR